MKQLLSRLFSSARERRERGAVMFLVAGTTVIVLLMGAVAVDLSAVATQGQGLQNAADSAALAGVQAYRAGAGDEAAAQQAVLDILAQNGIDPATLSVDIQFPDALNQTEVEVTITENDPNLYLAGVTGVVSKIERTATAKFANCDGNCFREVSIPPPFREINAVGDGDGYKPIPVGDRFYSINHNSGLQANGYTRGHRQITCVSRETQDHCWDTPGRIAYPAGYTPDATPEMPHAAVVGTTIYWASSTSTGHYLFCWETFTDTPCAQPFLLNSEARATIAEVGSSRIQHRGGGTVAFDDKIYTFTDDHRVHCIMPTYPMTRCAGYEGNGVPTALGEGHADFPANDPADGNHGSSIDRVVDEDNGRIYSTLHIDSAGLNCSNDLSNMAIPSGTVVIKNAASGLLLGIDTSYSGGSSSGIFDATDGSQTTAQWEATRRSDGRYRFTSIAADDLGATLYLRAHGYGQPLSGSTSNVWSSVWTMTNEVSSSRFRDNWWGNYMKISGTDQISGSYQNQWADWIIQPWQCADPSYVPVTGNGGTAYEVGTYVHCFDTMANTPCNNFSAKKLHNDSDSFSGRLFLHYDSSRTVNGICSTGFTEQWRNANMQGKTQLTCLDSFGNVDFAKSGAMQTFTDAIDAQAYPGWGTWGDPHYNAEENRLFYPTHRSRSRVLCWDFDDGWCGQAQGVSPENDTTEDYGFYSENGCVFALGHTNIFWGFHAEDIHSDCVGSGAETTINPCFCAGDYYWGTLEFGVDLDLFDVFLVEIFNSAGERILPGPGYEHLDGYSLDGFDGKIIDLNGQPATGELDALTIKVYVEAPGDPWATGDQTFTLDFARTPHLTD